MSDQDVLALIQELEQRIGDPAWEPDPAWLQDWNARFRAAEAGAERGPGWEGILQQAHALGARLPAYAEPLRQAAETIRQELSDQARGHRALKGYGSQTR